VAPTARDDADDDTPRLGESLLRRGERRWEKARERAESEPRKPLRDAYRGYVPAFAYGYGDPGYPYGYTPWAPWYPWYASPGTAWRKDYPPPVTHVPRLGMQYNYPYAYQMGIRVPDDSDPLFVEPNLGPFVGVVGAARQALEEEAKAAAAERAATPPEDEAITLLRAGRAKEAGRVAVERFQTEGDPYNALLLTEVFFALGKPARAEMLLRNALESPRVAASLPEDVGSHFPSRDEFEKRLQDLDSSGEHPLLSSYLKLHSNDPEAGLRGLEELARKNPQDAGVARLYRHYLARAFR